jgi:nicotinamide-nucleotide amidase
VETTILAGSGEIQLHFQAAAGTLSDAQARVDEVAERIEQEMGDDVFSARGESLEEVVLLMLGMRHFTLALAESCTGGLLAERLTAIPNSSRAFVGGVVAYTPEMKTQFCGVPPELLDRQGSVSEAVARALAEGIRQGTGASFGMGITGLAGPGGGAPGPDETRPVGLVYLALADGSVTEAKEVMLPALEMLRRRLL